MKEFIIPVNNEAHSRALVAIVGEDTAQLVLKAYKALDSAMVFGYERGLKEAVEALKVSQEEPKLNAAVEGDDWAEVKQAHPSAATAVEAMQKEAFKNGYDAGFNEGADHNQDMERVAYDDGYVFGVSDARLYPADADREVARLCGEDEDRADVFTSYDPRDFDEANVSDSGDEQPSQLQESYWDVRPF